LILFRRDLLDISPALTEAAGAIVDVSIAISVRKKLNFLCPISFIFVFGDFAAYFYLIGIMASHLSALSLFV